jgi:hypothetical protein
MLLLKASGMAAESQGHDSVLVGWTLSNNLKPVQQQAGHAKAAETG